MSLIQEALQRRNQETGAPLTLARPSAAMPPPLPPPPTVPPHRTWPWFLLVLVIVMVSGGVYWAFFLPKGEQAKAQAPVLQKPVQQPPSVPPVAATPTNVPATTNILAKAKATLETTVTPERRELVMSNAPAPVATIPVPAVTVPAPATTPPVAATVASTPAQPAPTPAPPQASRWPKLTVTGVMAQSRGNGLVFVNGQMLKRGENWEGAAIIEVTESGARFLFQGETNFIRVGHGTE